MSEVQHHADAAHLDELLATQVAALVAQRGVPGDFEQMWSFLELLMPLVRSARQAYYQAAIAAIDRAAASHGVEVAPGRLRPWTGNAAWRMLARALGWKPHRDPIHGMINSFPRETQREILERVVPFPDNPADPRVVEQAVRRITTGVIRHSRAAGRDAVVDTADLNTVRRADTNEPLSPGPREIEVIDGRKRAVDNASHDEALARWELDQQTPTSEDYDRRAEGLRGKVLGWARVLTGDEDCPWCAMLASRGPVYTETTVLTGTRRSATRDGLRYHDHCDCTAVLVVRGQPWEGEEQFKKLQDLWDDARENPTEEELADSLYSTQERFDRRYRATIDDDPTRFSLTNEASEPVPGVQLHPPTRQSVDYFGEPEPLPDYEDTVKHSLWGWKVGDPPIDPLTTPRSGHSADSVRPTGSFFPETWSDQDIADAISETMDNPTWVRSAKSTRMAAREINGVMVKVQWALVNGEAQVMSAFPLFGKGVTKATSKTPEGVLWEEDKNNELARYTRR